MTTDKPTAKFDLSPTGRGRVILATSVVTLISIAIAYSTTLFGLTSYGRNHWMQEFFVNFCIPTGIAVPVMYFLMSKLRELAIAHHQLTIYASTDGLTQVMNRAAFSTLVDAYLREIRAQHSRGALLIIDADNFKSVNDRYGHDRGDEALITIAKSIKANLRGADLVGRLGGEEFGVFLPGAAPLQAEIVAERIRRAVSEAPFAPAGTVHNLTVSVGGALFDKQLPFADLFRLADQQLYLAKQHGRNCVALAPVVSDGALAA